MSEISITKAPVPSMDAGASSPSKEACVSTSHRVSLVSSVSSSSIIAPIAQPNAKSSSLKRYVSSISSTENSTEYATVHKHFKANPASEEGRLVRLENARILQRDGSLMHGSITVNQASGLIVDISLDVDEEEKHEEALMELDPNHSIAIIDCKNQIVSPGFIDIQLNGAYGVDFSNGNDSNNGGLTVEDMFQVAEKLLSTGVTSFCPTMVSSSRDTYRRIIPLVREARNQQYENRSAKKKRGAIILGMHLEGPFFAPSKRGAHDNIHIFAPRNGMASVVETYGIRTTKDNVSGSHLEDIDIITMAPELDGAQEAIKSLTAKNDNGHSVVISCGHTEATYEDGLEAVTNGATLLTHLYNAMNPFHHRKPGLVGLLSSELKLGRSGFERPFYSMIVDGIHVHEAAVSMAYNSHPRG
jgi:N-acetylglucosamine-6-phosphate deacetylase